MRPDRLVFAAFYFASGFLLPAATPAHADPSDFGLHYKGMAYPVKGGGLRYSEEHWLFREQDTLTRLVLYRCPSGQAFARKWLRYTGKPWMPEFNFEDARDGYQESVRRSKEGWQVSVRERADAPTQSAQLSAREDSVIDAGFDAFVQAHWSTLDRNEGTRAAFLVPSRFSYLDLSLKPIAGAPQGSRSFRLSLDGWLGAIAPSIQLTYAEADHRLEEFVGISNIRDERGHRQRVRIDFPAESISATPRTSDIEAAANLPLTSHCAPSVHDASNRQPAAYTT